MFLTSCARRGKWTIMTNVLCCKIAHAAPQVLHAKGMPLSLVMVTHSTLKGKPPIVATALQQGSSEFKVQLPVEEFRAHGQLIADFSRVKRLADTNLKL